MPIEWPVTWPSCEAAVEEALRDGHVDVVRGRAGLHRRARGVGVLVVRVHRGQRLRGRRARADRPRELDPVPARPGDLEPVEEQVVALEPPLGRREPELRVRRALGPAEDHVHRRPVAACGGEDALGLAHQLGLGLAELVRAQHRLDAGLVDPHPLAHRLELGLGLDRAREVELLVERDELGRPVGERAVVAHGHHVVEAARRRCASSPFARAWSAIHAARMLGEDLLHPRLAVVADPARLAREDDRRVAVDRHDDVGVAVEDAEARQVADGALEARVLGAGDDDRVDAGRLRGLPNVGVALLDLGLRRRAHSLRLLSSPLTSAVSARLSGASTP